MIECCRDKQRRDQTQNKRKKEGAIKEGMIVEELAIPEVLVELMDTTHLLTQKERFMHRKIL
jgi:hypothetical protein